MTEQPTGRDRAAVIDDAFGGMQRWGLRLIVIAASVFVLGWIVGQLWVIIFPIAIALIISTILIWRTRLLRADAELKLFTDGEMPKKPTSAAGEGQAHDANL